MPSHQNAKTKTKAPIDNARNVISLTIRCTCSSNELFSRTTSVVSLVTFPNSVFLPEAYTTAIPRPAVAIVPANKRFALRLAGCPASAIETALQAIGSDSPVSNDKSTIRFSASINRASAEIWSPASTTRTSPTTMSSESTCSRTPLRNTFTLRGSMAAKAAKALSARYSCQKLNSALIKQPTMSPSLVPAYLPQRPNFRQPTIKEP